MYKISTPDNFRLTKNIALKDFKNLFAKKVRGTHFKAQKMSVSIKKIVF